MREETIFGGVILSHIDLGERLPRRGLGTRNFVTRAYCEVDFIAPVYVGDVVVIRLGGEARKDIGHGQSRRRSGEIQRAGRQVKVTAAEVVYVAVDVAGGRPVA